MRKFYFLAATALQEKYRNLSNRWIPSFLLIISLFIINTVSAQVPGNEWEFSRSFTWPVATTIPDFQIKIELNGGVQHAHMKPKGADLRFYDGTTELNYWIEKFDSTGKSVIWVKVPAIGTSALTMYYGNPAATTTSNGENTFLFFDGFDGSTLNTVKWTENSPSYDPGSISVSSGEVKIENKGNTTSMFAKYDTTLLPDSYVVELKHKEDGYWRNRFYITDLMRSGENPMFGFDYYFASNHIYGNTPPGFGFIQGAGNPSVTVNTDYLMRWDITRSTGNYVWSNFNYLTGILIPNVMTRTYPAVTFINISVTDKTYNSTFVDWVRIRKSGTLPAITVGSEVIRVSIPSITTISPSSGCEGQNFTINGTFQTNFGHIVKVGASTLTIVSATSTEIVAKFGTTSGQLTVTTLAGTSNAITLTANLLPVVNAGNPLLYKCSQGTSEALGGTVTDGNGAWSVDVPGGNLNTSGGFSNTTWTAPAGFDGLVTFTLTGTSGFPCTATATKTMMVYKTPSGTVAVEGDKVFCVGEDVKFTAPGGNTGYKFLITQGVNTSTVDNGSNPVYTATNLQPGATVQVEVTNNGCVATLNTEPFTVNAYPAGDFTSTDQSGNTDNDQIICKGEIINFNFSTSGYTEYKFLRNGSIELYKGPNNYVSNITTLEDGDQVTLEITGPGGCSKLFGPIAITVKANPTSAILTSDKALDTICAGSTISFSATAGFNNYEFFLNGQSKQSGNSVNYVPSPVLNNGNQVALQVKDANGCFQTTAPITVSVNDLPAKPVISTGGQATTFCEGESRNITLTAPAGTFTYLWSRNGVSYGSNTLIQNLTLHSEEGEWAVSLMDENKCHSEKSEVVLVTIYPLVPKPTITHTTPLAICEDDNVVLTSSIAKTYQWYYGESVGALIAITGQTGRTLSVSGLTSTGYYAVAITDINDCGSVSISDPSLVTVNALPSTPTITVTSGTLKHCEGQSVTLSAPVSSSYKWYHDNVEIPGATGQTYITPTTLASAGSYTVVVSNSNGCFSAPSAGVTVVINPLPLPTIDNGVICLSSNGVYKTETDKYDYVWSIVGAGTINFGQGTNEIDVTWGSTAGAKSLNVTYTDALGCRSISQAFFANLPALVPTFENGTSVVCVDSTRIYSTQSTGAESDYTWTVSAGIVISGGGSSDHTIEINWNESGAQSVSINYTKDGCSAAVPTIYPVTVTPLPVGKFSFAATPYCSNGTTASPAMLPGAVKGSFTSTPGLIISATTGVVNLSASTPGTYKVYNTVAAAGGCGVVLDSAYITITQLPTATIGYTGSPFCNSDNTGKPVNTLTGVGAFSGGSFSAPTGLTIDPGTGTINPFNNNAGSYTITYTIPATAGCPEVVVMTAPGSQVVITESPDFDFNYSGGSTFCKSDVTNRTPFLTNGKGKYLGGIYSANPSSLVINNTTGRFKPSENTPGTYIITYTANDADGCGEVSKDFSITITEVPTATITYSKTSFCITETSGLVTLSGTGAFSGGTYTFSPAGLSMNANGEINPSLSTAGKYTITYTVPESGGCAAVPVTTSVTISPIPEVNAGTNSKTCVGADPVNITAGADTTYASSVLWSGGLGIWSQATSLTEATYAPAAGETTGNITLTLTATGRDGCASNTSTSTKLLTINSLPLPVYIIPQNAPALCVGGIQSFISVKDKVNDGFVGPVSSSGSTLAIPDNTTAGVYKNISVSGVPSNAIITSVVLTLNITHKYNGDLTINLKAPNGKVLNIANALTGSGFINTIISSAATNPIHTSGAMGPFTGTYAAQMRYGTQGATSVSGNRAFAKAFDELFSMPNGSWILSARDAGEGDVGNFVSWSIKVNYSIPVDPVDVFWTKGGALPDDLYLDAGVSIPYDGLAHSVVYAKPEESGTHQYTATSLANTGCTSSEVVNLTISPSPNVYIKADYCSNSEDGKVKLEAMGVVNAIKYNWSSGETTPTVLVDIANEYDVSVTNAQGCIGTGILSVSQELVVNGDFEDGNTGFYTEYVNKPSPVSPPPAPPRTDGLLLEGTYAVDTSAYVYHQDFHGRDHTTSAQSGKFMIVNGISDMVTNAKYPVSHKRIIWEQTASVLKNTDYYFSAWATNFSGSNSPRLQFEVNGVAVGTIANLQTIPRVGNEAGININNWIRFYNGISNGVDDTWNSGENTEAVIRIINLEGGASGNDFGLDDISFGTLAPFVSGPDIAGRDNQTICVGESIQPIVYKVGSGDEPYVGLPAGFIRKFDGLNYTISGGGSVIPGTFEYVLETTGNCPIPATATGKITVLDNSKIILTSSNKDATICLNTNISSPINYLVTGTATGTEIIGLPSGMNTSYNTTTGVASISGAASVAGSFSYKIRTSSICKKDSLAGVITIDALPVSGSINTPSVCLNENGFVKVTGYSGQINGWAKSLDGVNYDPLNSNITDTETFSNINQTIYYKVSVGNGVCPSVFSVAKTTSIQNFWVGNSNAAWGNPNNWASGNIPTLNTNVCGGTVTIPKVVGLNKDPILSITAGVTHLNVLSGGDLTILPGGNLQVAGNITNSGIINARNGGIEYTGFTARTIESSIFLDNAIGDLKISNNNYGITLNAPVDVYRSLTFGSGAQKLFTNDQLTLKSTKVETASLGDMTGKTITGQATVERFINTGKTADGGHGKSWQLLATPTVGQTIKQSWMEGAIAIAGQPGGDLHPGYGIMLTGRLSNAVAEGFDIMTPLGTSIKSWNSVTGAYDEPISTHLPLYDPRGRMVLVRGDRTVFTSAGIATPTTLRSKGTFITGPQNFSVPVNSFAQIGNPYASAVNINSIVLTGMDEFITVWDPLIATGYGLGGFAYLFKSGVYYEAVPVTPSYPGPVTQIQSGQAFFVQTTTTPGTVSFTEASKTPGSTMVMRGAGAAGRSIQLRTNLYSVNPDGSVLISDGNLVEFGDDYSNGIDGKDARKISNTSENLGIVSNNKLLAIERRQPVNETDTLRFNLSGVRVQNYRFEFIAKSLEQDGLEGFLEDSYLGTKTPLSLEGSTLINFNIENKPGSYAADRFRVVFKAALAPLPETLVEVKAAKKEEGILVQWKVENQNNIKEYEIEKSSDGINFSKIGDMSAGSTTVYNYVDKGIAAASNYYRIKSVDENGKTDVSMIVKVLVQVTPSDITIYPNPISNGVVNVHLVNQPSGKYRIKMLNPVGQVMIDKKVDHLQGTSVEKINWDYKMARGMYHLEVTKPDGGIKIIKVMY